MVYKELADISEEQENELFRLISSVSFDFAFLYNVTENRARMVRFHDGCESQPEMKDNFSEFLFERVHPDDLMILEKEMNHLKNKTEQLDIEIRLRETGGRRFRWHAVKLKLVESENSILYVGASHFIDNRKKTESELTLKARQDPLTGLLNKVVTQENVAAYINKYPDRQGALMILDIDKFKSYNDTMGHLFGDEVIKEVATRIRRIFSSDSIVGRIGGDEFMIFVKNLSDISDLVTRLGKLRDSLDAITLGQRSRLRVTTSIGISIFPDMGTDYDKLFDTADMALYFVKNNGRNNFAIYTDVLFDEDAHSAGTKEENNEREEEAYSITSFAFHLLNESEDVDSALNLLLYKLQNEYSLEAIYVNEMTPDRCSAECIYEIKKDIYPTHLGETWEFSLKASQNKMDEFKRHSGYLIYDLKDENCDDPGNSIRETQGMGSVLQTDMRLFSESRGYVNFVTEHGKVVWTKQKIKDLIGISNIITVCLYYSKRVRKAEEQVIKFSEYDTLTGLMKEDTFIEAANRIISTRGNTSKLALLYCDISNFKYINETYGYLVGDRMLSATAKYITEKIPGVVLSGRFYSDNILWIDEFPKEMPDERLAEIVDYVNTDLSTDLSRQFNINNISISTGIYIIPNSEADILQSVSNANLARKIAKSSKKGNCVVFDRDMFEKKKHAIQLIEQLDSGIRNKEFFVVLQPKVSGTENHIIGAEALVRWQRSDGTVMEPGEFVPVFEKDGSIIKLDFYVYECVLAYLRDRIKSGKRVVPVSVNVSRAHLSNGDFVQRFKSLIDRYEVPTQYIELELTESIYLENFDFFNQTIERFREMGIRVSMDDFGSGYSSLNALNDLKIDLLKIDRIFMRDPHLKDGDRTIIKFIIAMAKQLSVKVMCEGVETNEQREFLNEAGCELHQGYLYSKPVTIDAFNELLDDEEIIFAKIIA